MMIRVHRQWWRLTSMQGLIFFPSWASAGKTTWSGGIDFFFLSFLRAWGCENLKTRGRASLTLDLSSIPYVGVQEEHSEGLRDFEWANECFFLIVCGFWLLKGEIPLCHTYGRAIAVMILVWFSTFYFYFCRHQNLLQYLSNSLINNITNMRWVKIYETNDSTLQFSIRINVMHS